MVFQNGEITISPYTLYWIQMPAIIGEADRIEMLKRNIFVIECQYGLEEYDKLIGKKDEYSSFFFNLDKILQGVKKGAEYQVGEKLAQFISKFEPDKSVIHTTLLDDRMRQIFQMEGLIYLEKNFNDKEGSVSMIMNLLKPLFSNENRIRRTDIRLELYPSIKYKTEVLIDNGAKVRIGYLKDISMSGVGIKFGTDDDLDYFSLKDQITLRVITHNSIFKVPLAVVTRKALDVKEIGVSFNITDTNMIREETANFIVKIIYKWVKDVILTHGKI